DHFLQGAQLMLGVEIRKVQRRVVWLHFLDDSAVLRSHHIASGKMHQGGVIRFAQKFNQMRTGATLLARASRRSGLKSVNPELLTTRSRLLTSCTRVCEAIPSPGWLTSPSMTSTRSETNSANRPPSCSWRGSNTGDSSKIFSKRRCAVVVRWRRISK